LERLCPGGYYCPAMTGNPPRCPGEYSDLGPVVSKAFS
jgi:hypothetical protein